MRKSDNTGLYKYKCLFSEEVPLKVSTSEAAMLTNSSITSFGKTLDRCKGSWYNEGIYGKS